MNHEAIYKLNPSVVTIRGDIAYDKDENIVEYDKAAVEAKTVELQTKAEAVKQTALNKLTALGLTEEDLKALLGIA